MNQKTIKQMLENNQKSDVKSLFEDQGHFLTRTAIFQDIDSTSLSASRVFELFRKVLDLTTLSSEEVTQEKVKKLRDALKLSLPPEVVDTSNFDGIPPYLDTHEIEVFSFFNTLWGALLTTDRDEETIGIGWAAVLHLIH